MADTVAFFRHFIRTPTGKIITGPRVNTEQLGVLATKSEKEEWMGETAGRYINLVQSTYPDKIFLDTITKKDRFNYHVMWAVV